VSPGLAAYAGHASQGGQCRTQSLVMEAAHIEADPVDMACDGEEHCR